MSWEKAAIAFAFLQAKVALTPILKHFDPDWTPVIVVHASKWAVSAALLQVHDQVQLAGDQYQSHIEAK